MNVKLERWLAPSTSTAQKILSEQRWFHPSEQDPATGKDTDTRLLFETRPIGDSWCLDAFVNTPAACQALLDRNLLHPLGTWYYVAMVYDGTEFRSYVDV